MQEQIKARKSDPVIRITGDPSAPNSTRERLLHAAEQLFAERGFYGTSIRDVAQAVGISKPSLIHHFPSKENLYSQVLKRIAAGLVERLEEALQAEGNALEKLHRFVDRFCAWSSIHENDARILMREILDNPQRLGEVHTWHLKALMDRLAELIETGQASGLFRKVEALPVIINLLGGQHYSMIVKPTLERIYGNSACRSLDQQQAEILKRMLDAELLSED